MGPYDEFGVVFSGCPLTEKTPWAIDSNNADPHGVEHHMCKAWEANIDATFEGNYNVHENTNSGEECCNAWFNDQNVTECELNIIQTVDGYPVDEEPEEPSEWWPTLAYPYDCTSEGSPP